MTTKKILRHIFSWHSSFMNIIETQYKFRWYISGCTTAVTDIWSTESGTGSRARSDAGSSRQTQLRTRRYHHREFVSVDCIVDPSPASNFCASVRAAQFFHLVCKVLPYTFLSGFLTDMKVCASNSRLYPSVRNFHGIVFISAKWKNKVCPIICVNFRT